MLTEEQVLAFLKQAGPDLAPTDWKKADVVTVLSWALPMYLRQHVPERSVVLSTQEAEDAFWIAFHNNVSGDESNMEAILRERITHATGQRFCRRCVSFHKGRCRVEVRAGGNA